MKYRPVNYPIHPSRLNVPEGVDVADFNDIENKSGSEVVRIFDRVIAEFKFDKWSDQTPTPRTEGKISVGEILKQLGE